MPIEAAWHEEEVHGSDTNEASDRPHRDDRIGRHGLQQRGKRVAERGRLGRFDRRSRASLRRRRPNRRPRRSRWNTWSTIRRRTSSSPSAFAEAYTAKHPNVTINVQSRPGGTEGDNLVKTKLATGDMTDIFWYNAGSLLQALNPSQTLVDLTGEPYIANIADSFIPTVSQNGGIFGVPSGTAMGGGILYNKKIFAAQRPDASRRPGPSSRPTTTSSRPLGSPRSAPPTRPRTPGPRSCSSSPTTATSRRPSRTSPTDYTNNKIKYADTPAALAGFQHLQEGFDKGWYEKDFGAASFDDGLNGLATGKFAQYPMLTFALGTIADEPSRGHQGHRVLRTARHGRRQELRDDLDAGSHLHPEDDDGR